MIGADEAVSQTVNLTVSLDRTSGDLTANVTDKMKDFNDDLGGMTKEIVIDIVVKKKLMSASRQLLKDGRRI